MNKDAVLILMWVLSSNYYCKKQLLEENSYYTVSFKKKHTHLICFERQRGRESASLLPHSPNAYDSCTGLEAYREPRIQTRYPTRVGRIQSLDSSTLPPTVCINRKLKSGAEGRTLTQVLQWTGTLTQVLLWTRTLTQVLLWTGTLTEALQCGRWAFHC